MGAPDRGNAPDGGEDSPREAGAITDERVLHKFSGRRK